MQQLTFDFLEAKDNKPKIVKCESEYQSKDFKITPIDLYRLDSSQGRMYYDKNGGIYPGVTSVIKATSSTPESLLEWMVKQGSMDNIRKVLNKSAYIGSAMHSIFAYYVKANHEFDIDKFKESMLSDVKIKEIILLGLDPYEIAEDLIKHLLAFVQFIKDHNVEVIAIEIPTFSKELGVASMIDFICLMDVEVKGFWGEVYKSGDKKGQPKETKEKQRVHAALDFKSSVKTYANKDHELQLALYDFIIKESYPEFRDIDLKLYNWHPKDWRTIPGYSLIDQTGKHSPEELREMCALYHRRHSLENKSIVKTHGIIKKDQDISENYSVKTYKEIAKDNLI